MWQDKCGPVSSFTLLEFVTCSIGLGIKNKVKVLQRTRVTRPQIVKSMKLFVHPTAKNKHSLLCLNWNMSAENTSIAKLVIDNTEKRRTRDKHVGGPRSEKICYEFRYRKGPVTTFSSSV